MAVVQPTSSPVFIMIMLLENVGLIIWEGVRITPLMKKTKQNLVKFIVDITGRKMNKNYQKGIRLERNIVNLARSKNMIALRSAGSHSPVDCVIIDQKRKIMYIIQAKAKKDAQQALKRKLEPFFNLTDEYLCKFMLVQNIKDIREVLKDGI